MCDSSQTDCDPCSGAPCGEMGGCATGCGTGDGEGVMCKPRVPRLCGCLGIPEKPPVPSPCMSFGIVPTCHKDYITQNIKKACRQIPRKPALRYVDDHTGTTRNWCNSGYPRIYVYGENFGKVPCYLQNIKQELCNKKEMQVAAMASEPPAARHLDEDERNSILAGLKKNWEEIFAEYQSLPLNINTPGQIQRKSELEQCLKCLEKDIQLMEKHDHIFVANTNRSFYLA